MKIFESGLSNSLSNILRIRIRTEAIMDILFFPIAPEIQVGNMDGISMNTNLEIFESKFDFDKINSIKSSFVLIEFIFISIKFFLISTQINSVTVDISTPIKAKTLKTIKLTNKFILINISKNSKFLPLKFVKENALANSIKKKNRKQ